MALKIEHLILLLVTALILKLHKENFQLWLKLRTLICSLMDYYSPQKQRPLPAFLCYVPQARSGSTVVWLSIKCMKHEHIYNYVDKQTAE